MKGSFYDCCHHQLGSEEAKQSNQEIQELHKLEEGAGSNSGNSSILRDSRLLALLLQQSENKHTIKYFRDSSLGILKENQERVRIIYKTSGVKPLHILLYVRVQATRGCTIIFLMT